MDHRAFARSSFDSLDFIIFFIHEFRDGDEAVVDRWYRRMKVEVAMA